MGSFEIQAALENQGAIDRLTGSLRTLEERRRSGLAVPPNVTFFLAALDRILTDEERGYVAMVFAMSREIRDELTSLLEKRLGMGRGSIIAGIRAHLAGARAAPTGGDMLSRVTAHLDGLRAQVLAKAARLG